MVKKTFFFWLHFIQAHSVKKNLANIFPGMIVTLCGTDLSYVTIVLRLRNFCAIYQKWLGYSEN